MSSRLHIYQSNRLENLFELLQALYGVALSDPFASEKIIVSSKGMERWLRFKLADRVGICAGIDFQLPASFVWSLLKDALPHLQADSPYSASPLAWRLFGVLPTSGARAASPIVAAYLSEGDARRQMALAGKLADVFDQYLVFRSHWIAAWEAGQLVGLGPDEAWQATLWREVKASIDGDFGAMPHRADMFVQLFNAWQNDGPSRLPERITVFGIAGMPPAYIDVLGALAEHIDVNLFLLNPCREEWGAIVSAQVIARRELDRKQESLYLDIGHPLLASMGKAGRDFYRAVTEAFPWSGGGEQWLFYDPLEHIATPSLLQTLQSDVLNLLNRDVLNAQVVAKNDRSLTFHNAHSAMREVEILHDEIAAMLVNDDSLLASEIAVLLPDMGPYAPLIEAVFGDAKASGAPNIPFNIADLTTQQECPAVDVLMQLLQLPESRCKADEMYGLLETPQVAARFDISSDQLLTLRHWIAAVGIRWGLDAAHRAEFDLSDMGAANTWQLGLDRLLLGLALPNALAGDAVPLWGEDTSELAALAPWDDLEGSQASLLAKLTTFITAVGQWRAALSVARTLPEWRDAALLLLENFILFDEHDEAELKLAEAIRTTLADLADEAQLAGLTEPVPREVVCDWLQHRFENSSRGSGFMSRGVTFCTMVPMRGLPFRVVAVLGLNENDFPRNPPTAGFDLIAQHPRLGDRSRRLDDRYLFLDLILAAREKLYLSWVGRSLKDDAHFPPSVLVSDVLDCVAQGFFLEGDIDASIEVRRANLLQHLTLEYPLQPFSLQNFVGHTPENNANAIASFNPLWCRAAEQIALAAMGRVSSVTKSADEGEAVLSEQMQSDALNDAVASNLAAAEQYPPFAMPNSLRWDELAQCLAKPAAYFLRHRANLHFQPSANDAGLEDDEAFDLKDFRDNAVRDLGLKYGLEAHDLAFARGNTPLGVPGEMLVDEQLFAACALLDALPRYQCSDQLPAQMVQMTLSPSWSRSPSDVQITGWLDACYADGRIVLKSQIYPRDVFRAWVEHLLLCAMQPSAMQTVTRWLSPERVLYCSPIAPEQATAYLSDILALYQAAMAAPLPFFPHSALAWGKALPSDTVEDEDTQALRWAAAIKRWLPSFNRDGEWLEVQNQLLWPQDPLQIDSANGVQFTAWATRIVLPMLAAVEERTLHHDLNRLLAEQGAA
ncbi:exodeoxyribonuclease V subunit gamma [Deefgea piscis]|uniref:RecBCD enzyme subunit RecC n=1 Tax=Deefgea piscis TaxID=2739061 RepID=A0A6M8SUL0_9NEIS|nr:exodeoxyribonuclease V subunit gamma [Deefgea piscis]QKJ67824.1 exodeoxyribonuclease V subunit gamma [Deefgea piscis]